MGATMELWDAAKEGWQTAKAAQAKRNILLSYWCKLFEGFNYSPREFYAMVQKNLELRGVPDLETYRLILHQSGVFSAQRAYLQLRRERLVFEICAAPFGTGFFVSSRLFDRRREARLWHFIVLLFFLSPLPLAIGAQYGWTAAVITVGGVVALVWSLMRLASVQGLVWLDRNLPEIPLLGPIYEWFFHPDTYYRQDLNNSYREAVHGAVMQAIDAMTTEKGLKPLTAEERRPILHGLHRRRKERGEPIEV